jgi:hypothetical protein
MGRRSVRGELARLRMIDNAKPERDPATLLK